jgi:transcription elongation GreA/GreB family factor
MPRGAALALAALMATGAAAADPAMVFVGPGWEMSVESADVENWQVVTPRDGGVALLVWLKDSPAGELERLTGGSVGETIRVEEPGGEVLLSAIVADAIRGGRFAITFQDAQAARRTAGRLGAHP